MQARNICLVGSYSPRRCGIATFTTDLCHALSQRFPHSSPIVTAINDVVKGYCYPDEVQCEIEQEEPASYQRAAELLNSKGVDLVCLQHEFGIFGGVAGGNLLGFLKRLRAPVVTTLHTVLEDPNPEQEWVMREVIRLSSRLVVMTRHTEQLLLKRYQADKQSVDLIAHGIPDTTWVEPAECKAPFGVEGRSVLLTFGLLSPGKGIEVALGALPEVIKRFPEVVYIILGATHPHLVREHGETYRLSLKDMVQKLGLGEHVLFFDRFVELDELTRFIAAADLYLTPYLNEEQAVSGTLAYAFGCGKPVISTPYWHAKELLKDGMGVLVPFADSQAISQAVNHLLGDIPAREAMAAQAYQMGRTMIWSRSAEHYAASFERALKDAPGESL